MKSDISNDDAFDQRLAELERELGPRLRSVYRGTAMRPELARTPGQLLVEQPSRPLLSILGRRAWAALAATVVGAMVVGVAVFANQPQTVSASDVLDGLQSEAISVQGPAGGPGCGSSGAVKQTGGVVAMQSGGPDAPRSRGPVSVSNATDFSDRLAAALGVSGDRVRSAMLATVQADLPAPPPDPMAVMAKQLGVSTEQVCAAFSAGPGTDFGFTMSKPAPGSEPPPSTSIGVGGKSTINLATVTADDLKDPAQKLGVSPEQLLAALKASAPPSPPAKLNPDDIIRHFAQNLGMSEDKVRAAMTQVEGKNVFYFAVPVPQLPHP